MNQLTFFSTKHFILICGLIIVNFSYSQSYGLAWVNQVDGNSNITITDITRDLSGNIYTTGVFQGAADFDPSTGVTSLVSSGISDIFIQKTDSLGGLLWVKQIGGLEQDASTSIVVDSIDNIYIGGYFRDVVDFNPNAGTSTLVSSGARDIFMLKLNSSGSFLWVKQIGGIFSDELLALEIDSENNLIGSGKFFDVVDFDPSGAIYNIGNLGSNMFLMNLDSSGNIGWAKEINGNGDAWSLALDSFDNIYVTGKFNATIDLDPGSGTYNISSLGLYDGFVAKFSKLGEFVWGKQVGGSDYDAAYTICVDNDSIFISGYFQDVVDFDPGSGVFLQSSNGDRDIFLLKLDTSGNFSWCKQIGGPGGDYVFDMSLGVNGDLFMVGSFYNSVDFDPGAGDAILTTSTVQAYILKVDFLGGFQWLADYGENFSRSFVIDVWNTDQVVIGGEFSGIVDFNPGAVEYNLNGTGSSSDMFLQKLNGCTVSITNDVVIACDSLVWEDGLTYYSSTNSPSIVLSNSRGCDSIVYLDLTVNNVSDITTSISNEIISANNLMGSYQWLDCEDEFNVVSGETNNSLVVTGTGYYAVEITENGCVDTSECVLVDFNDLNEFFNILNFYPNPVFDQLIIETNQSYVGSEIIIVDLYGKVLLNKEVKEVKIVLNLSFLSSGIYFIKMETAKNLILTRPIIKK